VSNIYLSHCVSDTTLFSGFWCSYHCKTFVCSNCHVLSYPYTSVSFSQISNFQNIFTIFSLLTSDISILACPLKNVQHGYLCAVSGWRGVKLLDSCNNFFLDDTWMWSSQYTIKNKSPNLCAGQCPHSLLSASIPAVTHWRTRYLLSVDDGSIMHINIIKQNNFLWNQENWSILD
jgi:hypothetical protein